MSVLNKITYHFFKVQQFGSTIYQCYVIHAKRWLKCCVLIQSIQYNVWNCISFKNINYPHTFSIRFISNIWNAFNFFIINQFSSSLNHVSFIYLIRNFSYDYTFTTINFFKWCFSSHYYSSSSCFECLLHSIISIYYTTCWKIRSFNMLN